MPTLLARKPLGVWKRQLSVLFCALTLALVGGCSASVGSTPTAGAPRAQLTHGPVVGAVTATSARVFVQTDAAASVKLRYNTTPDLQGAVESPAASTRASDFTAQITLDKLNAASTYYFDIVVDGVAQLTDPLPRFKTFPTAGTVAPFRFVVLTDFRKPSEKPMDTRVFGHASDENPDFVILGGDMDHRGPKTDAKKRQMFQDLYTPANGYQEFVNLILRRYPLAHFWDDHDIGTQDADKTYRKKTLSLEILQEYFPLYPVSAYGDWQQFTYGHAAFWLLDSRSQRDPNDTPDGPDKSMLDGDNLGDKGQWVWLTQSLRASTARWKFILTPVPFNPTVVKLDSWRGFKAERARLVQFLHENHIEGVIFISGDVHAGGMDDGTHSDFPEMLVPSPNMLRCSTADDLGAWSEGTYLVTHDKPCYGYGVVTISTNPDRVELTVKDESGTPRLTLQVK